LYEIDRKRRDWEDHAMHTIYEQMMDEDEDREDVMRMEWEEAGIETIFEQMREEERERENIMRTSFWKCSVANTK
jgi:hypothetical protein